jgi:hypothetical protein
MVTFVCLVEEDWLGEVMGEWALVLASWGAIVEVAWRYIVITPT